MSDTTSEEKPNRNGWKARKKQLLQYKLEHGNIDVPRDYPQGNLGKWVHRIRNQQRNGKSKLSEDQVKELNDLGFVWELASAGNPWKTNLDELEKYKSENGDANVPDDYEPNPDLAKFVKRCRRERAAMKKGKASKFLTEERIVALDTLGFVWDFPNGRQGAPRWDGFFDRLKHYKSVNGDCDVRKEERPGLFKWCHGQRVQYGLKQEGKPCSITEEQVAALNEIGFDFAIVSEAMEPADNWEDRKEQLCAYKKEHGHVNIPRNYKVDQLGRWVHMVRMQHQKKTLQLNEEQVNYLDELGFVWTVDMWKPKLDELTLYKEKHGDVNVPEDFPENPGLSKFVQRCRRQYSLKKKGKPSILTEERVAELNALGFVWRGATSKGGSWEWDDMYLKLKKFHSNQGHSNVTKDRPRIFKWLQSQKRQYRSGDLTEERAALLKELDVDLESNEIEMGGKDVTPWDKMYTELKTYHDEHGHCGVPRKYDPNPQLAGWTARMKQQLKLAQQGKATKLTPDRQEKLERLDLLFRDSKMGELRWKHRVMELACYKEENGDCAVPKRYEANPELAAWVASQRRNRGLMARGKHSDLTDERIAELDGLGFIWGAKAKNDEAKMKKKAQAVTSEEDWQIYYVALVKYKEEFGDCAVPADYEGCPGLASWIAKQRGPFRKKMNGKVSRLNQEQYDKLSELGFATMVAGDNKGRKKKKGAGDKDNSMIVAKNEGKDDFVVVGDDLDDELAEKLNDVVVL